MHNAKCICMKLDDLELPKVKVNPEPVQESINDVNIVSESSSATTTLPPQNNIKKVIIITIIISFLIGLFTGGTGGFLIARNLYNQETKPDNEFSKYDYSQFVINKEKGITIADLYHDDEERFYAMVMIGMTVPNIQYVNSKDETLSINDLGQERYIIEIVQPTCNFCMGMVPMIDEYRVQENAYPVIGLSILDGDITKFNTSAENTFILKRKDETTGKFADEIPWVPTFLFVEKGIVHFVSFGNIESVEKLQEYIDIAFN